MNYNTDGFNERSNFIHNSNDLNKSRMHPKKVDTSISQMKVTENKSDVKTYNEDSNILFSKSNYKNINQFNLFRKKN